MINITQGNSFTLYATFTKEGVEYIFTEITAANLISRLGKSTALPYAYNGGTLTLTVPSTLAAGTYTVEVVGTEDGEARRTAFADVIVITTTTVRGGTDTDLECDDYDIGMRLQLARPLPAHADAERGVTALDVLLREAAADGRMKYNVRLAEGDTEAVSVWNGSAVVSGESVDELLEEAVRWEDPSLARLAGTAWGSAMTYGDLMEMTQASFDEWIAALKAVGCSPRTFRELGLMRRLTTLANLYFGALRVVEFPAGITAVSAYAFSQNSSGVPITRVSLPAATSIGAYAFQSCTALSSVSLPAATSIGAYTFHNCSALSSVSLPAATSIGAFAFNSCTALSSVSLPQVTSIGEYAFQGCTALSSVSLPQANAFWGNVFYSCTALSSVSIPASPIIQWSMFTGCTALKTVIAPKATTIQAETGLSSSKVLETLVLGATPPSSAGDLPTSCTVYVPDDAVAKYQAATAWKSYTIKSYTEGGISL